MLLDHHIRYHCYREKQTKNTLMVALRVLFFLRISLWELVHKLFSFVCMCPHSNSPAEGVTLMTSTPSGRAISWLYRLCVVTLRRQALCRLEVQGLLFGGTGGLNMSKLNGELFAGEAVSASFSLVLSSGGTPKKKKKKIKSNSTIFLVYYLTLQCFSTVD